MPTVCANGSHWNCNRNAPRQGAAARQNIPLFWIIKHDRVCVAQQQQRTRRKEKRKTSWKSRTRVGCQAMHFSESAAESVGVAVNLESWISNGSCTATQKETRYDRSSRRPKVFSLLRLQRVLILSQDIFSEYKQKTSTDHTLFPLCERRPGSVLMFLKHFEAKLKWLEQEARSDPGFGLRQEWPATRIFFQADMMCPES